MVLSVGISLVVLGAAAFAAYVLWARWYAKRLPPVRVHWVVDPPLTVGRVLEWRTAIWTRIWQAEVFAIDENGRVVESFPIFARRWDTQQYGSQKSARADVLRIARAFAERGPVRTATDISELLAMTVIEPPPTSVGTSD